MAIDYFPQFSKLPIGVRSRIWEALSLNPVRKARLLCIDTPTFAFDYRYPVKPGTHYPLPFDMKLISQTEHARTMLSTHRDSRLQALTLYPHKLPIIDGEQYINFHRDRDIIWFLSGNVGGLLPTTPYLYVPDFSNQIVNLALGPWEHLEDREKGGPQTDIAINVALFESMPNLKNLFIYDKDDYDRLPHLGGEHAWIETDHAEWNINEDDAIWCWHKTDRPCEPNEGCQEVGIFGHCRHVDPGDCLLHKDYSSSPEEYARLCERLARIKKWPMRLYGLRRKGGIYAGNVELVDAEPGKSNLRRTDDPATSGLKDFDMYFFGGDWV